jgi:hypothetical protein
MDEHALARIAFFRDADGVLRDSLGRARPDCEDMEEVEPMPLVHRIGLEREGWDTPPEAA